ncbi:MAG: histidine phosphatase family protein [Solirubrobacterales bacterium]|nr:histidine phosphatase family protein [Solirubrobacterales bacterium]
MAERVYLVRHGETEWSKSGQHTSRTDLPLLEEGRARAMKLKPVLAGHEFSLVLCSPLRRARETCELAGLGSAAELVDDLREWDYGEYEGLTTPEIWEQAPQWNLWRDGCPGGERPEQVAARADRVLARVDEVGGEAITFAHGHVLRVLAVRWLRMDATAGARFALAAGSLSVLSYERETEVVERWNASE